MCLRETDENEASIGLKPKLDTFSAPILVATLA